MESFRDILRHYGFGETDEANRTELAKILLPFSEQLAHEFYDYLVEDPYTRSFFPTDASVKRRKETLEAWFSDLLTSRYDSLYHTRLQRIGKVHVKVGLRGHYVNASMYFIRDFCRARLLEGAPEGSRREAFLSTLDKVLDINLDVLTSSYREEELKHVFLSHRVESALIRWAERLLQGLNLVLMVGLLSMAVGVLALFAYDVVHAFSEDLEHGVIKALGSLLILWMMIELLHAEVKHLRGGGFHVRIFLELAMVAFIRKLFVAALEHGDPVNFALLLGGLLVLGVIFFLVGRTEGHGEV